MTVLSHTQASALLDCEARHDFRYVGRLAGDALSIRTPATRLREGRAWGRAVAAFHLASEGTAGSRLVSALSALAAAIGEDAAAIDEAGGHLDPAELEETHSRLTSILADYAASAEPLNLSDPELELRAPLPNHVDSFHGFLDGLEDDSDGRPWIVEFKLRGSLSPLERLALDRQGLRYGWAFWQATGELPAGIVWDERLNAVPVPPKINKDGKPSRDKKQYVRPEAYASACYEAGVEPDEETLATFGARQWQQRHRLVFTPSELEEAGRELDSIANRILDLEAGCRWPVRAPSTARCGGCAFREICPHPEDTELVDALFQRVPAKRDREELPHAA